jgi:hypothetical protein
LRACLAEQNALKRDEIAARQRHAVRKYQGPGEAPIRICDVKDIPADEGPRPDRARNQEPPPSLGAAAGA